MSTEPLPLEELRRRFRAVAAAAIHLKVNLPPNDPHNAVLRTYDIAHYIGVYPYHLNEWMHRPPKHPKPERIQRLSEFFRLWETGELIKAKVEGRWKLIRRTSHASLAKMAPPPVAPAKMISLTIDRKTLGLKVGR